MFGAAFFVHLGLSWALLGHSRVVQTSICKHILGWEKLILGGATWLQAEQSNTTFKTQLNTCMCVGRFLGAQNEKLLVVVSALLEVLTA